MLLRGRETVTVKQAQKERQSAHRTQWAAQFAVASELCKRGYEVALTMGNHPVIDLMVVSPEGVPFLVEVKGQYKKNSWPVRMKKARQTYDWLLSYYKKKGKKERMFDTKLINYVFSRKPPKQAAPGVEFVSEPVKAFAQRLRAKPGKHIWMVGGGELIATFLGAGEIDEFDIHVIPNFIGEGIPLVAPRHRDIALRLLSAKKYPDGVVRLHYEVQRKS